MSDMTPADLISRLRPFCSCAIIAPRTCATCEAASLLTAQAERIAELEKDAARYRWLREQTEAMAADELARALQRLPELTAHEQQVMGQLVHRLVNKFLHAPTTALREQAAHSDEALTQQIMTQLLAFTPHEVKHDA